MHSKGNFNIEVVNKNNIFSNLKEIIVKLVDFNFSSDLLLFFRNLKNLTQLESLKVLLRNL